MNRVVACLSVVAVLAAPLFGVGAQPKTPQFSLGSPTPVGNLPLTEELPMPDPLPALADEATVPYSTQKVPLSSTPTLQPVPEVQYNGPVGQLPTVSSTAIQLYPCVKYRDTRKIAPCATPIVVAVPDPCSFRDRCGPRPCAYVEICVPTTGCPTVCVTRNGNKTRYDYGKYAVNVITHPNRIVVDYDF